MSEVTGSPEVAVPASSSSLSVVADAVQDADEPAAQPSAAESLSAGDCAGWVSDPPHRRGIRHSVQSVLLLVVGAVMVGKDFLGRDRRLD
jgi:hypothetical protein